MIGSLSARQGRPKDLTKAASILDAAYAMICRQGSGALSIEALARSAGVSKVTIYHHFSNKDVVVRKALEQEITKLEQTQSNSLVIHEELAALAKLRAFGLRLLTFLSSARWLQLCRAVLGADLPPSDLPRRLYELGYARPIAALSDILTSAHALSVDHPGEAAELLLCVWLGTEQHRLLLGMSAPRDARELAVRIEKGIATALKIGAVRIAHVGS